MKIIVDGNDGTGKSTLVEILGSQYDNVFDRGVPTRMTDDDSVVPDPEDFYIILDAPVAISHARLQACGKPMDEYYHTIEGLTHYRNKYLEIVKKLGKQCTLIDANQSIQDVVKTAIIAIETVELIKN